MSFTANEVSKGVHAMSQEEQNHTLTLQQRGKLVVTGVTEVVSFEETAVLLQTCMGLLQVQGDGLQLKTLSVEGGQVEVEGTVSSLVYEENRLSGGWMSRLFR